ncbi:MAG: response regulator [Verrucomicrobia bacterium]|nr:response regulator [Verrucomicrobiota bacterium]
MADPSQTASSSPLVVLLVDDELPLLDSLRLGLGSSFDVDLATSTAEADLMMATRRYDVVVSDHLMPGEEGLQFLLRASERYPETKRILITGYANPELLSRSVGIAGLAACLFKPVRAAVLADTILQAVKGRS